MPWTSSAICAPCTSRRTATPTRPNASSWTKGFATCWSVAEPFSISRPGTAICRRTRRTRSILWRSTAFPLRQRDRSSCSARMKKKAFLEACDDWQFPLFLTLMLTGLRTGELTHLLLPDDLDLSAGLLRVRNKPALGWHVKTRNERDIPLVPVL